MQSYIIYIKLVSLDLKLTCLLTLKFLDDTELDRKPKRR